MANNNYKMGGASSAFIMPLTGIDINQIKLWCLHSINCLWQVTSKDDQHDDTTVTRISYWCKVNSLHYKDKEMLMGTHNQFTCIVPQMAEGPYDDGQTKLRLELVEGQGNGANQSNVDDIFGKKPSDRCSSKAELQVLICSCTSIVFILSWTLQFG
jgi:hypothetical protein